MLEHFGLMPSYFRHKTQFGSKEQSSKQKAAILSMMSILSIQSTNSIILSIHSVMRYSEHFLANFWGPSLGLKNFTHKHTKAEVYHLLRAENKKYLLRWPWYRRVFFVCVFFFNTFIWRSGEWGALLRFCQNGGGIPRLTWFPSFQPISSETRAATDMAATRRGWVQPTFFPSFVKPCRVWTIAITYKTM